MTIRELIREAIETGEKIPSPEVPYSAVDKTVHVPLEYQKATSMHSSYQALLGEIRDCDTDAFESAYLRFPAETRALVYNTLSNIVRDTQAAISRTLISHRPNPQELPLETLIESFKRQIDNARELLHEKLNPIITRARVEELDITKVLADVRAIAESARKAKESAALEVKTGEAAIFVAENIQLADNVLRFHQVSAWCWFGGFLLAVTATGFVMWHMYTEAGANVILNWLEHPEFFASRTALKITGKILIATFATGICLVCGRNYQNHIHNIVIANQRKIALTSFYQIYKMLAGEKEIDTQAIRLEFAKTAAEAIMAHTSSGFLSKGGEDHSLVPALVEMAKKAKA